VGDHPDNRTLVRLLEDLAADIVGSPSRSRRWEPRSVAARRGGSSRQPPAFSSPRSCSRRVCSRLSPQPFSASGHRTATVARESRGRLRLPAGRKSPSHRCVDPGALASNGLRRNHPNHARDRRMGEDTGTMVTSRDRPSAEPVVREDAVSRSTRQIARTRARIDATVKAIRVKVAMATPGEPVTLQSLPGGWGSVATLLAAATIIVRSVGAARPRSRSEWAGAAIGALGRSAATIRRFRAASGSASNVRQPWAGRMGCPSQGRRAPEHAGPRPPGWQP
jgi:hypothetical protein